MNGAGRDFLLFSNRLGFNSKVKPRLYRVISRVGPFWLCGLTVLLDVLGQEFAPEPGLRQIMLRLSLCVWFTVWRHQWTIHQSSMVLLLGI